MMVWWTLGGLGFAPRAQCLLQFQTVVVVERCWPQHLSCSPRRLRGWWSSLWHAFGDDIDSLLQLVTLSNW
jgi:hypothetical protein